MIAVENNVFSARRSGRYPVYSALQAVTKGKGVVIFGDHFSSLVLDCFDGALAYSGSNDIQRCFEMFRTISENLYAVVDIVNTSAFQQVSGSNRILLGRS